VWGTNFTGIDFKPFDPQQLSYNAWQNELNCHVSSSMGRLFDAAAFACCEQSEVSYEGQAPMMLESVASTPSKVMPLSLVQKNDEFIQMDWRTLVPELFDFKVSPQTRAANFHASLIETVWEVTLHCRKKFNFDHIGLAGGVFQNRMLCDGISQRFLQSDIPVVIPSSLPLNDAAISVGQIHEYCSRRS
jgi:hydrogenase maturation protein HypF